MIYILYLFSFIFNLIINKISFILSMTNTFPQKEFQKITCFFCIQTQKVKNSSKKIHFHQYFAFFQKKFNQFFEIHWYDIIMIPLRTLSPQKNFKKSKKHQKVKKHLQKNPFFHYFAFFQKKMSLFYKIHWYDIVFCGWRAFSPRKLVKNGHFWLARSNRYRWSGGLCFLGFFSHF